MVAFTGGASQSGGFSLPSQGGGGFGGGDLSSSLTGVVSGLSQASSGESSGAGILSLAGTGATIGTAFGPVGTVVGGAAGAIVGGMAALFSHHGVPDHERGDLQTIAANDNITEAQASAVCGFEESHSPRNYDEICSQAAQDNAYFLGLVSKYNASHPGSLVTCVSAVALRRQQAEGQQKMITTALTTQGFASTATGQQFVAALQNLPPTQVVGTQGQTVGDILGKVLDGAVKGGSDAAAETAWGKKFKWSYIKDWMKENQLLAFFLAIIAGLGLVTVVNIVRGKHGTISI